MKLASFVARHRSSWGLVENDEVCDLGAVLGDRYPDLRSLLAAGALTEAADAARTTPRLPVSQIQWAPVVPNPSKILCVGHNYESHRAETGRAKVDYPSIFLRFADTQIGHDQPIIRPKVSVMLDFEGELAVIIGKPGRYIAAENAFDHVAGYCTYNDASVRDWQWHTTQFAPGKNFPRTGACGPWMVTADEVADPAALTVTTRLNGQTVQSQPTSEMIFSIPAIIAYVSSFTPLSPGDIISTGTPGGVGAKRQPPLWMKAGDVVEVEIPGVGLLVNRIEDEA